jgi:hypothetical protein
MSFELKFAGDLRLVACEKSTRNARVCKLAGSALRYNSLCISIWSQGAKLPSWGCNLLMCSQYIHHHLDLVVQCLENRKRTRDCKYIGNS